jgi:hypothetical protein
MPSTSAPDVRRPARSASNPDARMLTANRRIAWALITIMAVNTIISYELAGLSLVHSSGSAIIAAIVVPCLLISCCYYLVRPDARIAISMETLSQALLVSFFGMALCYSVATAGLPYRDSTLSAVDRSMGLDWIGYLHFVNEHRSLSLVFKYAYDSTMAQFFVMIVALTMATQFVRLQQYIIAMAIALIITVAVFAVVPAAGTYAYFQIDLNQFANVFPTTTADQMVHLDALRSGKQTVVEAVEGMISFPSFHSTMAILYMWAFFQVRYLRTPAILLNLIVLASTPIQGAHYFADLPGGIAVAVVSIYFATQMARWGWTAEWSRLSAASQVRL